MDTINDSSMLVILKIFGLYRVGWGKIRAKLSAIYFTACFCVSVVCVYHGNAWRESFGENATFNLRNFLVLLHMWIFFIVPIINFVQFGFINKFEFSSWRDLLTEELLAEFNVHAVYDTFYVKMFHYLCISFVAGSSVIILYEYGLVQIYDYFPLPMMELWCLLPVLEYLEVTFVTLELHRVVLEQMVFVKKAKFKNRLSKRWSRCLRRYTVESAKSTVRKLKTVHKAIMVVCYEVIPREYGFSVVLLVISYAMSFIHDVALVLPEPLDLPKLVPSLCRSFFKFSFLIVFFRIGETNSAKLKNLSLNYLHRDLTFKARATMRITCRQYLSIMAVLMGYIIVQIQILMK